MSKDVAVGERRTGGLGEVEAPRDDLSESTWGGGIFEEMGGGREERIMGRWGSFGRRRMRDC